MKHFLKTALIAANFFALPALAHEYYLMPESFLVTNGDTVSVSHKLGQKFKGNEMPYINRWNIRSEVWEDGKKRDVSGLDGDRPALKITASKPGVLSVVHQSNIDFLIFKTWEKFQNYARKEGIEYALDASIEGRKPKEGLKEAYARYAKTLISVGGASTGADTVTGLKIELVALKDPAYLKPIEPLPVQLLFDGQALAGSVVKVFVGVDTEFAYKLKTDGEGMVQIPARGKGPYLLNAIKITEPQSKRAIERNAHWESFWASLTFERRQ